MPEFNFTGVFLISNIRQNFLFLVKIEFLMPKIIENILIEKFKDREYITREDLYEFYHKYEPDLKEGTFGWRIYDLKDKNIIRPLKRGLYVISYKPKYKPAISNELLRLTRRVTESFEEVKNCIWETTWLNEFSQHQASRRITLIEIEKDFMESLYYELKDIYKSELFLNPDEKAIDFYISESNNPIIIKRLITRSPITKSTEKRTKLYTPLLEKILVDLFADEKLFYYLQGSELIHIFENAINHYAINFTKLFSYATRREREQDIKQFMTQNMYHLVKDIIE